MLLLCLETEPEAGNKKASPETGLVAFNYLILLLFFGRGGGIRTRDPLHPMQVRYQAALRPDSHAL